MTRQARAQRVGVKGGVWGGGKGTDNRVILRARHSALGGLVVLEYKNTRKNTDKLLLHVNGQRSDMQTYAEVSTFMDNLSLYLKVNPDFFFFLSEIR